MPSPTVSKWKYFSPSSGNRTHNHPNCSRGSYATTASIYSKMYMSQINVTNGGLKDETKNILFRLYYVNNINSTFRNLLFFSTIISQYRRTENALSARTCVPKRGYVCNFSTKYLLDEILQNITRHWIFLEIKWLLV